MNDLAIRAEGLSKRYRIGAREGYDTVRDALLRGLRAPLEWVRNGRRADDEKGFIWALRGVSLEIKTGEVVGVIGRNGAGKTTLLKILSRITAPTAGYAEITGRVGSLLEVGTGFHPELTGRENIYLNGTILGMTRREITRRFDEIVAFAEVEQFIDTPVKRYSTGMHMRLAFAVAAHLQTEILLIDEVLAVGDAAFQKKCLGKIGSLTTDGRTILLVSHNLQAVRSLCSRALFLHDGKPIFFGTGDQCVAQYLALMNQDTATAVDTEHTARPGVVADSETFRISRVHLRPPDDNGAFYTSKPLVLRIDFAVRRPLTDLVLAWSVHSGSVRLFECQSVGSWGPTFELRPGNYSVDCEVSSNPLNPGVYTVHVGARCSSKGLDYLPDVIAFTVDAEDKYSSVWLEAPSGFIRLRSTWTLPRNAPGTTIVPGFHDSAEVTR